MNLSVLLSIVLTLALVAMFALGLYWLNAKNRPHPVSPPPVAPASFATGSEDAPTSAAFNCADLHEWEANAHTHEHDILEPLAGRNPSRAENISDIRRDLHEAMHDAHHDASSSFASTSRDARATTSHSSPAASTPRCPQCRSLRIDVLNRARKAGRTIGSVAGATSGMAMALSGAEAGAVVGSFAGPIGTVFGGLAGAVIAGLVGSAAGCAAGSAVGAAIDDNVLDSHLCLSCGHTFSAARS